MRVAVTGAGGRLGRALVTALADAPFTGLRGPLAWPRATFDLDAPDGVGALLDRERPEVVIHAAAWTDVDGCARDPELAVARNGSATGVLAGACTARGIDLIAISTNEVFDGRRTDGRGYAPTDETTPLNPYGASKLAGELAARAAFAAGGTARLAIARTAWLFGPGAPDFPAKILAAADRAADAGEPLKVVGDEWGCPTYVADVAEAIVELLGAGAVEGTHHLVNGLFATRADWARYVVARAGLDVEVVDVPASTWARASTPPRWGVLEPTQLPGGEPLRPWPDAMADYAPILLRGRSAPRASRPASAPASRPAAR
jgi:dTDP-4-dehydrorhamnose reductase